jgi:hypothetical protein
MKQFLKKRVENVSRPIKDDFEYITLESSTFFSGPLEEHVWQV